MSRRSFTDPGETREARRRWRGQALVEFGITIPLLLVVILGIFQLSYLIYQQYVAVNLAREGANLILRDTTSKSFDSARWAIEQADPLFGTDTTLILSVVQLGDDRGSNAGLPIIIQRLVTPAGGPTGVLGDPPQTSYLDGDHDYMAIDATHDTSIRAKTPLPNNLQIAAGQSVHVAEIYRKRRDIVPLAGVKLPDSLYAVAYF